LVIGMLMYLASNSHPEIQYAVHQCARFTHNPHTCHEQTLLCICHYLHGTWNKGLVLKPLTTLTLDCYVNADIAGLWNVEHSDDPVCVKSCTGYVLTLGGSPLIWAPKLQSISLSLPLKLSILPSPKPCMSFCLPMLCYRRLVPSSDFLSPVRPS